MIQCQNVNCLNEVILLHILFSEISFESRKITSGAPVVEFAKVSIWVSIESVVPVSPTIFLFRSPSDVDNVEIQLHGLEEILRY